MLVEAEILLFDTIAFFNQIYSYDMLYILCQYPVGTDESEIFYVCMYVHHVQTDSGYQLASCLLGKQVGMTLISQF